MGQSWHRPVMVSEVMEMLDVRPGTRHFDGTVGGGGHAQAVLERSMPDGLVVGLDRDPEALEQSRKVLSCHGDRVILRQGSFADVVQLLSGMGLLPVDGVLLDLGVSSYQLRSPGRGFTFDADGPLDMRMDPGASGPTAADLIERLDARDLGWLIRSLGEEPAAGRIARSIKRALARQALRGTADLARVVCEAVGRPPRGRRRIHPATRTFMALRMAVNDELGALEQFLRTFTGALRPGGRVVIIAFHSLEDRAVKRQLARLSAPCTCPPALPLCACGRRPSVAVLTPRPLRPGAEEVAANPRARSAKLRAAEML